MANVMLVLDGMQDIAYDALEGQTPYDYGKGEHFRYFEAEAETGSLLTTPRGFEPDTQTCILCLLGVPPEQIPEGRSYIEALALGLPVSQDDLVLRCNFVKVSGDGALEVPCCSAPEEIAEALRTEVAAQKNVGVYPVGSYKSLQLIRGAASYIEGMRTSMPHQHQGERFEELLPSGNKLSDRLADFSRSMLQKYTPYTVLNWAQAVKAELPSFSKLHCGINGGMVSATDAPIGIAKAMWMECPRVEAATGDTDTDLAAKLEATLALLEKVDFVLLHIGGPDEATHRQDPVEKADFFGKLDRELMAPLMEHVPHGTRIMLTCDHEALCSTAGHTTEPVRFWLWEKGKLLQKDHGVVSGDRAVSLLCGKR